MIKYNGDFKYIIPVGVICLILLIVLTITGYKRKKNILNKYEERYGFELPFYRQLEYISLYRHTCVIVITILILNIISEIELPFEEYVPSNIPQINDSINKWKEKGYGLR